MPDLEPPSFMPLLANIVNDGELLTVISTSIILAILLFCSAMVSGSEVAFFSLSPNDIKSLEESESKNAKNVIKLIQQPKVLLANILIANNFINVGIVMISAFLTNILIPIGSVSEVALFLIQVVAITFIILLIGEVLPKVYATKNNVSLAKRMATPLYLTGRFILIKWLRKVLVWGSNFVGNENQKKSLNVSADELEHALEITKDENTGEDEHRILKGIVKFGNTEVRQIMKSRVDVIAFDVTMQYSELIEQIMEHGFSRIPVYEDSFDNIRGVLYIKDLLSYIDKDDSFNWQELIREPYYVPENKKIDDLLKSFQERKMHLAIVVDEYGGTSGIVTLEDVLEEIVGDITDEFDDEDLVYSKLDENNYVFEGKISLIDMYRVLGIDGKEFEETKGDAESLAGFLIEQSGKILKKNERINFDRYTFTIEAADKRRVKRVKISIRDLNETEE